ncbi:MAG: hypothetical protein LQ350_002398 [Teloschistes chrysophthalmus]|nr:MAG: hypothetical protein LQ350_002398 [Niorma chrysophthalma]
MAQSEDLIDFDIIETHKENIQSLPGGRSAKALASTLAPLTLSSKSSSPGDTRNLNDTIRHEYEIELSAIADSDDPLDIYDRYVKWTLNAYPSAQATPESQLRPLLERATKAFQSQAHYKNDPRYLKLWLNYIRFFSDAPRETFAYLARHNIGEGLALFYEEFAAWLEGADRWIQADEVYNLGIEREARPTERLVRKFGEFQHRFGNRDQNMEQPSSPALPTVRPALAAKVDPFALSTPRPADPQAPRSNGIAGSSTARGGRQKLAIFSDADAPQSDAKSAFGGAAKGWDNIGSIAERRKENTIEARPWAGETLKTGKKMSGVPKMAIFKDEQQIVNPKSGRIERVFVNLEAVYPNPDNPTEEYSFEELRAKSRGWLDRDWAAENKREERQRKLSRRDERRSSPLGIEDPSALIHGSKKERPISQDTTEQSVEPLPVEDMTQGTRARKSRRIKVMEVKGETQTVKTNLESPTGPKLKRKSSAEPTMTLHTKAATDDILDIFNQPLRNVGALSNQVDSAGESEFEDDDYTSAGESTGTGAISGVSEFGDDEEAASKAVAEHDESACKSASPWSDFTASKHVPQLHEDDEHVHEQRTAGSDDHDFVVLEDAQSIRNTQEELVTPIETETLDSLERPRFVPLPPEDCEPPTRPYRDPSQVAQNRLPFMTPIVEKTESSFGALTIREAKDYFNSKTPSRQHGDGSAACEEVEDLLCSPFQEIINNARVDRSKERSPVKARPGRKSDKPVREPATVISNDPPIKDTRCNPIDDSIRNAILDHVQPELLSCPGYHDYRPQTCNKASEIRKFIRALAKTAKGGSEKTTTTLSVPPTLRFAGEHGKHYAIKRELGKGAFAPVYLAQENTTDDDDEDDRKGDEEEQLLLSKSFTSASPLSTRKELHAIKCEDPPTPWEFYIMSTVHSRLPPSSRAIASILLPYEMHLFADEGYLVEQYLDQGTLLDLVNIARADSQSGVLDESIAMFFTVELLRTVEALHSIGILHGDLKADNCLVRLPQIEDREWDATYHRDGSNGWSSKGLSLIDMGRGIDMRQFSKETQFIADWKTTKADCAEMREMRPWTYQVDYWGAAGVVHSLLFGKYIEDVAVETAPTVSRARANTNHENNNDDENDTSGDVGGQQEEQEEKTLAIKTQREKRYRIREPLKRYWQCELWANLFDLLLNPTKFTEEEEEEEGGKMMPVMKGMRRCREGMEEWLEGEGGRRGVKAGLRRLEERIGGGGRRK